jgi:HK97 family phage major capsid protein
MDAAEMREFKETAEKLGKAAADLQATNEQTTKTVGDLQVELKAANDKINEFEGKLNDMRAIEARNNRPDFASATGEAEGYKESFIEGFVRKGNDAGLSEKAGSISVPGDGGYLVPQELDNMVLSLLKDDVVMRQESRVIQVGSQEWKKLVKTSGSTTGWVGETDSRPATDAPKWAQLSGIWGELYANPQITQALLEDSMYDIEADLTIDLAQEFAEAEEAAFTVGDGTKKPKGFLAYTHTTEKDGVRAFGSLQKLVSTVSGSFSADDLITLQMTLKKAYRKNAKWMMSNSSLLKARLLKDSNGNYLWQAGLTLDTPSTLLGQQVAENEQMPDVAAGALPISIGDFKRGYFILDRLGMGMLRDPYSNKPNVGFYTTKRVGGVVADSNAIKTMEILA